MTVSIDKLSGILVEGPASGSRANLALALRLASGAVFLVFGAGKFVSHASEVDSFRTYGLPSPDAFVYAIGTIEVVGGALLIVGLGTRLTSLVLAGDMVGAIIVSGFGESELVSSCGQSRRLSVWRSSGSSPGLSKR